MPVIEFQEGSPKLPEAWDETDDWTQVDDPKERRRRQNRLHQRAHRRKRHFKALGPDPTPGTVSSSARTTLMPASKPPGEESQTIFSLQNMPIWYILRCTDLQVEVMNFLQKATADWSLQRLIPRDLPTLSRLNAFDALCRNAQLLKIPVEYLESDDYDSPLFQPQADRPPLAVPKDLSPTDLQQSVKHHSWLDLFPFPKFRNNIIEGIQRCQFDEDVLCHELVCDFLNLTATDNAILIIWGNCWDMNGWEFSAKFFEKWGTLLKGCDDVLQATNSWRAKRRVMPLEYILD